MTKQEFEDVLKTLVPGDWISFVFGFTRCEFYVLENDTAAKTIRLGRICWLTDSSIVREYSEFYSWYNKDNAVRYLGRGKKKWYFRYLKWLDIVHPFYRPKK